MPIEAVQESLHKDIDVSTSGTAPSEDSSDEDWIELTASYESSNTMLNGMLGFGRMGIQRAFWQPTTKEIVMIIWYGGALSGWPGIAHGGCTATFFIEGLGKAVNCVRELGGSSNGNYNWNQDSSFLFEILLIVMNQEMPPPHLPTLRPSA